MVTSSVQLIDANSISQEGFELSNQQIIPNEVISSPFTPQQDLVEFWVYDINNNLLSGEENFINYILTPNPPTFVGGEVQPGTTSELKLNPSQDTINAGYDVGQINAVYNFITYKLGTSLDIKYYVSEISSDRTELRLNTNFIENEVIQSEYVSFNSELESNVYFDEFYLNFGSNQYQICVNSLLDTSAEQYSILIKLYDALPSNFNLMDEVSVVVKPAESIAYNVTHPTLDLIPTSNFIKGPNFNLKINEFLNNSTGLKSNNDLLNTPSTASANNLTNVLNRKGITLTPNYSFSTFSEFVNFSSAKKRIENFIEKVTQIQTFEADIALVNTITGSTSQSFQVISTISSSANSIETLIKNFDGYEYFLYYGSGSSSYPKTNSIQPYTLSPVGSAAVSEWLGSDIETSAYYGGISLSASLFDDSNQNWLYYTIPEFIRDNSDNNQYLEFSNMVGQSFDEVWLYTKSITEKLNTTSQLTDGVPLDLADDVIASLGYDGFGNNFNNQDNFIGLLGENDGSYVPPTGSELITNYIAVNNGEVVTNWEVTPPTETPGYPYAIDKVSKEIFKRLYHNMSYLLKKKGTISGLRQLINIWGIPNTILRINEFGGKNKDNVDDYDLWYNRYNYAYTTVAEGQSLASSSIYMPWAPLERNRTAGEGIVVPDSIQFRFKTTGYPSSSVNGNFFTQSLAIKKSNDTSIIEGDFGISLFYEPVATGSYSGSHSSELEDWGRMRFFISGSAADGGVATSNDIYLPFYDKGWWSVMLQRDQHVSASVSSSATTYTLYAKNKINNGFDGNSIGFEGSASIVSNVSSSINHSWNNFVTSGSGLKTGIFLGGNISGSTIGGVSSSLPGKIFSGSFQEFRYLSNAIPETKFNDYVMNPESIEGNNITGSQSSFDIVNFRAPLGNELKNTFKPLTSGSSTETLLSMHPAVQGNANILITGSFFSPTSNSTSSAYEVEYYPNDGIYPYSRPNTEVYFLDQPAIGFRNRVSNKIQVKDGSAYGNILSNRISIQQDYQISQSYTENINNLEVAFSLQDEVNDDIIASFGYGVVADAIADPRFVSSSDDYYPQLKKIAEDYFKKYTKGNASDYLRLIGYFDNSIFKAIKSYVPARTSVSTGIVVKQHMLERNRFPPIQISEGTTVAFTPSGSLNTPLIFENIVLTSSIDIVNENTSTGGSGGSLTKFNYVGNQFLQQSGVGAGSIGGMNSTTLTGQNDITLAANVTNNLTGLGSTNVTSQKTLSAANPAFVVQIVITSGTLVSVSSTLASGNFNVGDQFTIAGSDINVSFGGSLTVTITENLIIPPYAGAVGEASFGEIPISQSWNDNIATIAGLETFVRNEQSEFYNGEFSGSVVTATTQSLLYNPFATQGAALQGQINATLITGQSDVTLAANITNNLTGMGSTSITSLETFSSINPGLLATVTITSGTLVSVSVTIVTEDFKVGESFTIPGTDINSGFGGSLTITITENLLLPPIYNTAFDSIFKSTISTAASNFMYEQSVYYPTPNNALENRPNTDRYVVENQLGINTTSNLQAILSGTATKAQTPNSNYTIKKLTIPRYLGSKISSADYNNYTPSTSSVSFLDGAIGSWVGDNSYGDTAVVDHNPIYFAHFQSSRENLELFGTFTFDVDQLIEIPFENITKESLTVPPVTLKIDGSNKNLLTTSNVFEKTRGVTVSYENQIRFNTVKTVNNVSGVPTAPTVTSESLTTDYSTLNVGNNKIYQGGLEYLTISTNQLTPTTFLRSMSFDVGNNVALNTGSKSQFKTGELVGDEFITYLASNRFADAFSSINTVEFGSTKWAETGSGYIDLLGGAAALDVVLYTETPKTPLTEEYYGPSLALMHTYNYWLNNQIIYLPATTPPNINATSSFNQPGLPYSGAPVNPSIYINPEDSNNYFRFNPTSPQPGANAFGYIDSDLPFLLQRGDEIRVTYNATTPQDNLRTFAEQDFTVTGISDSSLDGTYSDIIIFPSSSNSATHGIKNTRVYNRINVTPNPSTIDVPIIDGEIYNFTVRRRVNADDRVIVYQTPPQNSFGSQTIGPGGYLIPEDLTLTQKDNVNTLINQLKAQNVLPKQDAQGDRNSSNTNTE